MRHFLALLVLFFSLNVFAGPTKDEIEKVFLPLAKELSSFEDAEKLANKIAEAWHRRQDSENDQKVEWVAEVYHLKNGGIHPYFERLLKLLALRNVPVQSSLIDEAKFIDLLSNEEKDPTVLQQNVLTYSNTPVQGKKFKERLFGLVEKVSFVSYFFKRNKDGKIVKKYEQSEESKKLNRTVTRGAVAWIAGVKLAETLLTTNVTADFNQFVYWVNNYFDLSTLATTVGSAAVQTLALPLIIGTWVYTFFKYDAEVKSFRSQGCNVSLDDTMPDGDQMKVVPNQLFSIPTCYAQDILLFNLVSGALEALGVVPVNSRHDLFMGHLMATASGIFSATAWLAVEDYWIHVTKEIQKKRSTHPQEVPALEKQRNFVLKWFWNLLYPASSNTAMQTSKYFGWWSNAPFVVLGTVGAVWNYGPKMLKYWLTKEKPAYLGPVINDCKNILILRAKETKKEHNILDEANPS
jgi:hypothetical protein